MEENGRWLLSGVLSEDSLGTMGSPFIAKEFSELVEVYVVRHGRREVVTRNLARLLITRR